MYEMFKDKKIMVTGAGGSIGSALCRKLNGLGVKELVLFEQHEYSLYKIDEELTCNRIAVLGDVKDHERIAQCMPVNIVFHCAAYKHVPMCEGLNARYAYDNNVLGTEMVMRVALCAEKIVLLSTDKAINPKGVMGRTKRGAEQGAYHFGRTIARLGNILESSGSVIPKFREQIAKGGPVTVTHPETTRYFIEMDKAVEFLLDCAAKPAGTYMVDMGQPQKILDIAKKMIAESGKNIEIVFTGLRPGEKLHEDIEE